MNRRTYRIVEYGVIGAMVLGFLGMFQPWQIELYHYGFLLLLFSTLVFIIVSHIPMPQGDDSTD